MKFSIIIPAYNAEKFIGRCLDSVVEQDFPYEEYEIIVVDDFSLDRQNDVINEYISHHPTPNNCPITLLKHAHNTRQGGARNTGVAAAQGEWIMYLDSDDFWCDDKVLKNFSHLIDQNPTADIINSISHTDLSDPKQKPEYLPQPESFELLGGEDYFISPYYAPYVWRGAYRKNFISKFKFREYVFFEDGDYCLKTVLNASLIVKIDYPFYGYINNPGSTIRGKNIEAFFNNVQVNKLDLDIICSTNNPEVIRKGLKRLKSNVFSWLKISKDYPLLQSRRVFRYAKHEMLLDSNLYILNGKERVILVAMKYAPLITATSIKSAVYARRWLRKAVRIFM